MTDLKEAQETNSLSAQDRQTQEGGALDARLCLNEDLTDENRVEPGQTEIRAKWSKIDEVQDSCNIKIRQSLSVKVIGLSFWKIFVHLQALIFVFSVYSRGTLNPGQKLSLSLRQQIFRTCMLLHPAIGRTAPTSTEVRRHTVNSNNC